MRYLDAAERREGRGDRAAIEAVDAEPLTLQREGERLDHRIAIVGGQGDGLLRRIVGGVEIRKLEPEGRFCPGRAARHRVRPGEQRDGRASRLVEEVEQHALAL